MIVKYSNGITITKPNDQMLSATAAANVPTIDFGHLLKEDNQYYTLIMYDPDAPTANHNFVHWIIINIQSNTKFDTLLAYTGPNPPPGSGVHRYIFNLYNQPNVIAKDINKNKNKNKRSIPISGLLKKLNLTKAKVISSVSFTCSSTKGGTRKKSKRRFRNKRRQTRKTRKI